MLIMPVSRVPRYRLLTEDLLKATPNDHSDRLELQIAIDKLRASLTNFQEEARRVNDSKGQSAQSDHRKCVIS